MVTPSDFCFNEQTAVDNEFQKKPETSQEEIRKKAIEEFNNLVDALRKHGVEVMVLDPCEVKGEDNQIIHTPDAVFPNNWVSTDRTGRVVTWPMKSVNRKAERKRLNQVLDLFKSNGFEVKEIVEIDKDDKGGTALEGTGSIVFDHINKIAYAALSERTNLQLLEEHAKRINYQVVAFNTKSAKGVEYYHTNVMMSVGDKFAVVCTECIVGDDAKKVVELLKKDREVIEITRKQVEESFCGNILQTASKTEKSVIAMSENAYKGFTKEQLEILEKCGKIVAVPVPTIESVGGGSVRCMMAEVFLPRK
jgi:hypothetical protein